MSIYTPRLVDLQLVDIKQAMLWLVVGCCCHVFLLPIRHFFLSWVITTSICLVVKISWVMRSISWLIDTMVSSIKPQWETIRNKHLHNFSAIAFETDVKCYGWLDLLVWCLCALCWKFKYLYTMHLMFKCLCAICLSIYIPCIECLSAYVQYV